MNIFIILCIIAVVLIIIIRVLARDYNEHVPVAMAGDLKDYIQSIERDKTTPSTTIQNFELPPVDLEVVRYALARRQYQLRNVLSRFDDENVDKQHPEYQDYLNQVEREKIVLDRINDYLKRTKM